MGVRFVGGSSLKEGHACAGHELIGTSAAMAGLRDLIGRIGPSEASVLVMGPSGSGKELVAQAIHRASGRSGSAFVALNCGAIPAELMESELFGHERGAFTGALARRIGRFEEAHRGTLFLDEIGDMRFDMQVKLLRILEDGLVQRVGGGPAVSADVRIVSATHQDLEGAIADGRFREDLYFRLGVVPIRVPALAERAEDVPALIAHFRRQRRVGGEAHFTPEALARLMAHDWPGNVRELRNVVARADILFAGQKIGTETVEQLLSARAGHPMTFAALGPGQSASPQIVPQIVPSRTPRQEEMEAAPVDLKVLVERLEQERIQTALDAAGGIISEAARLLTLKRTTLIEKMRKYGVGKVAA